MIEDNEMCQDRRNNNRNNSTRYWQVTESGSLWRKNIFLIKQIKNKIILFKILYTKEFSNDESG